VDIKCQRKFGTVFYSESEGRMTGIIHKI